MEERQPIVQMGNITTNALDHTPAVGLPCITARTLPHDLNLPTTASQQEALPENREFPYNEVMLQSAHWISKLPHMVQAVFFPAGSTEGEERARTVHRDFLRAFALSSEVVPLLRLDLGHEDAPFSRVS